MTRAKQNVRELVYIAVSAVLLAACSWITVPSAVEFTMQTFGVFFVLAFLGGRRGTLAILVYVLLGAVGAPVFAGFSGGVGALLSASGGYITGFVFMGLTYWGLSSIFGGKRWGTAAALLAGLAVCYAFGTAWFMLVYARTTGAVGLGTALVWCVLPFIPIDLVKLWAAMFVAGRLRRIARRDRDNKEGPCRRQ